MQQAWRWVLSVTLQGTTFKLFSLSSLLRSSKDADPSLTCSVGHVEILHLVERQDGSWCCEGLLVSKLASLDTSQCQLKVECDGNCFPSLEKLCILTYFE